MSIEIAIAESDSESLQQILSQLLSHRNTRIVYATRSGKDLLEWLATSAQQLDFLFLQEGLLEEPVSRLLKRFLAERTKVIGLTEPVNESQGHEQDCEFRPIQTLRKPIESEELQRVLCDALALAEASASSGTKEGSERLDELDALASAKRYDERLALQTSRNTEWVNVEDIEYLRAEGNYVSVHAQGREFVVRSTMTEFQSKLDPDVFLRVHRSFLVRVDKIMRMDELPWYRTRLKLQSGGHVFAGRGARAALKQKLRLRS